MQQRRRELAPVTLWGRLIVLLVLATGFFTMHGFFAVSASADTHRGQQHGVAVEVAAHADAAAAGAAPSDVGGAHPRAPGNGLSQPPDRPQPAEHHDLLAGCVVALVGIGLAGLALLLLRRSAAVEDPRVLVSDLVHAIGLSASRWSVPRVALCVIRV